MRLPLVLGVAALMACASEPEEEPAPPRVPVEPPDEPGVHVWVTADAHVTTDIWHERESLADAIMDSERGGDEGGPAFAWDVMLHLGDIVGGNEPPLDEEGEEIVRQFDALVTHARGDVYNLCGNHDASGEEQAPGEWFRTWIDPLGENSDVSGVVNDERRYPVEGDWTRYSFEVGNILFLVMSDRNEWGRVGGRGLWGGYPAGSVSQETFEWWVEMVEANQDKIIISAHHHMLRETTIASGPWEGVLGGFHAMFVDGEPRGAGYLYFVGEERDAQSFERYLEEHPGAIDVWVGGHTHARPLQEYAGRTHVTERWGVTFVNAAGLTRYHGERNSMPMSRRFSFTEGSSEARLRLYLHTSEFADEGWFDEAEHAFTLRHPFVSEP